MVQDTANQSAEPRTATGPCECSTARSSMATMCMGMMGKRPSGLLLMLPGILLIAVGAAIVIEPQVVVWLLAAGSVLLGAALLVMGGFIRRMGARRRG